MRFKRLPVDLRGGLCYNKGMEIQKREHRVEYTDGAGRRITLCGTLWEPQGGGKYPAVIFSHGFNGHGDDFSAECAALSVRGFVCYAFDFCGAQTDGASEGRTASAYTPLTMKEDLRAAIADVENLRQVDKTRLFLFGGSQGGLVTALTAADEEIRERVRAIVLYFPALNIPADWRGKPERETPLMGYFVGAEYVRSVQTLDPFSVIGNFRGDVCIVWGDRDMIVPKEVIGGAVKAYGAERAALTVIAGAGHGFSGDALKRAIGAAVRFLEAHATHGE